MDRGNPPELATARETSDELTVEGPSTSLNDRSISLAVTGATPKTEVTVVTETRDGEGVHWRSRMVFEADECGVVDLTTAEPISGTYDGVAPMGWLWSMRAPESDSSFSPPTRTPRFEVTVTASNLDATETRTLTRRTRAPDVCATRWIDDPSVVGHYYRPSDDGPHPGVLVLHDADGTPDAYTAGLLASHGYATVAVKYFGKEEPLPDRNTTIPLSYFDTVADWLRGRDEVTDGPIGVVGKSQGGEGALLIGSHFDWVGATVAYVPMTSATWALGNRDDPEPGWELDGEPVPYVGPPSRDESERTDEGFIRWRPNWQTALEEAERRTTREAATDVERNGGPVLFVSGTDDQVVPSTPQCEQAVTRLREADFEYPYEHLAFEGAGHRIEPPYLPAAGRRNGDVLVNGGTVTGYAAADTGAWPTVLDYLNRGLESRDSSGTRL